MNYSKSLPILALTIDLLTGLGSSDVGAAGPSPAAQVLQLSGVKTGLCLVPGCGSKTAPGLVADLAGQSSLLVHGLAADDAALQRTRQAIEAQRLAGRAMAEKAPLNPLPYLNDLANLVVIEEWDTLAAQGVKLAEVERVVAPGGILCVNRAGRWTKTVKARPLEMDEWPQPQHGPDGNRVSADRAVRFPVGLRWQDGMPMNFNLWAACRSWVIANGRCFSLGTTELENLAPASFGKHKQEEYLTARDAFNGLPLWKVNCETLNDGQALTDVNSAPLVADGQQVYVYKKDRVVALDAATGAVVKEYPVKYPTIRLLLADQVLVACGWEGKSLLKGLSSGTLWAPWVSKNETGAVEAFDAAKGTRTWSFPSPAQTMVAADGLVYLLLQSGNPPTNQALVALDLASGKERWRVADTNFAEAVPLQLNVAGQGVVVVARRKAKSIAILSAQAGKVLWEINGTDKFWTPLVNDELWQASKKYDPKTGQVKGKLPVSLEAAIMCTPSAVAGNWVTASRGCSYTDLFPPSEGGTQQGAKQLKFSAARGGCIQGATPANGLFYTGQNFCRCSPGQVPGFVAFGPSGEPAEPADFTKPRLVDQGPAFAVGAAAAPRTDEWPMHRHDAERSGGAKTAVPQTLKSLWQTDAARPAEGPLAAAWQARLTACLSTPVCANGKVFVTAPEMGRILALEAATGKEVWRVTLGGRVDTPPTLHAGRCLFGAHDGWLYALDERNGQLAWRVRLAPLERRMVAFGQVESVWPAIGSVLVHEDTVYASAGRSTEADGGLVIGAFQPATGAQLWAHQIPPGPVRQNDLLVLREGKIGLHHLLFEPKTGEGDLKAKGPGDASLEGLGDGSWTRMGTRRSGRQKLGRATAELFAWDQQTVFGYDCKSRNLFALSRTNCLAVSTNKLADKDYHWRVILPANHQVEALALGEDGLALAGRKIEPPSQAVSGFVWVVGRDHGEKRAEQPLPCAPVYDGLALARQRLYLTLQTGQVWAF